MIRHIVFDMGQVLVRFSDGLFSERLRLSEADAELIRREVRREISQPWAFMAAHSASSDRGWPRSSPATSSRKRAQAEPAVVSPPETALPEKK